MRRQDAVKKASKFLRRGQGARFKKKARDAGLSQAQITQIIADYYQRGQNPKDYDLISRLDLNTSYNNVRTKSLNLIDRKTDKIKTNFEGRRQDSINSGMEKFRSKMDEVNKGALKARAKTFDAGRKSFNRHLDQSRKNEKTLEITSRNVRKWAKNPSKYDLKGIDTYREKSERTPTTFPFQRDQRIKAMKKKMTSSTPEIGVIGSSSSGKSKMMGSSGASKLLSGKKKTGGKSALDKWDGNYV